MYVVLLQTLREGKPLDPAVVTGDPQPSIRKARRLRGMVAAGWLAVDPHRRHAVLRAGTEVLMLDGHPVGYVTVDDRRDRKKAPTRYLVEVQGQVVARLPTKAEAAKVLWREVERWKSSRYPRRTVLPYAPRDEWSRQILRYFLLDRGSYAGEARVLGQRPASSRSAR